MMSSKVEWLRRGEQQTPAKTRLHLAQSPTPGQARSSKPLPVSWLALARLALTQPSVPYTRLRSLSVSWVELPLFPRRGNFKGRSSGSCKLLPHPHSLTPCTTTTIFCLNTSSTAIAPITWDPWSRLQGLPHSPREDCSLPAVRTLPFPSPGRTARALASSHRQWLALGRVSSQEFPATQPGTPEAQP